MTAPAVAWMGIGSNVGKVHTCEAVSTNWTAYSGSISVSVNTTNFIGGASSLSEKCSNTTKEGYTVDTTDIVGEPFDFSASGGNDGDHIFAWLTAYESWDTISNGGYGIIVADDLATDSIGLWHVGPQANFLGGWRSYVINPSADFNSVTAGTAVWTTTGNPAQLSGVDGFGCRWKITASITGNIDNTFVDNIVVGQGYEIILGDAGSTEGVFADFITFEDNTSTGRFGGVRAVSGIVFAQSKLIIGDISGASNTEFIDTGFTVVWEQNTLSDGTSSAVAAGFYELRFTQDTGTTDVTLTQGTLSAIAPHTVDLNFSGINSATLTQVNVDRGGAISLDSAVTWTNSTIKNSGLITAGGATLTGCDVSGYTGAADSSSLLWNTAGDPNGELDNMSFTKTSGVTHHAIEFGSTAPVSITLTGITFTDFNASNAQNDSTLHFTDGSGKNYTVNVNGGSTPSYKVAGTSTVSVVNSQPIVVSGVTEGTAITVHADETLGTRSKGDLLFSGFADVDGEINTSIAYEAAFDPDGLQVLVRARNQGIAVAAIAEDSGTGFTDETTEASSNTTADMTLLPATPALNDAYYFGHTEQFLRLKLDVSTALAFSGQPTIVWEYWNGAWVALSGVSDGTQGFENSGENIVSWTTPASWATTTVNSQGPFYYVRARLSVVGTITTVPVGRKATIDATRYLPYVRERQFESTGLSDVANWVPDSVSKFTQ
jgi:hypothetical protein